MRVDIHHDEKTWKVIFPFYLFNVFPAQKLYFTFILRLIAIVTCPRIPAFSQSLAVLLLIESSKQLIFKAPSNSILIINCFVLHPFFILFTRHSQILLGCCLLLLRVAISQRPMVPDDYYTSERLMLLRDEVAEMFYHAYDGYMQHAYPLDELQPLTCRGVDTWGSYSLTLIDALDTLIVMGNATEFQRVAQLLSQRRDFDADINVSVFETNIRVVGGLLSAHLLSHRVGIELEPGWPCNGPLLRLAEDAAQRLLPAFNSSTGMPYGTVNLRYGVPPGETPVTCTAGVGTFIVEFGVLSRLTGDSRYEDAARRALDALWRHRSAIGLVGNHVNVETGQWVATDSGIGAAIDSYFEYLVKGSALLSRPELADMFAEYARAADRYMWRDDWYFWVTMSKGAVTMPVFQNLEAYWPGVLSSIGRNAEATRSLRNYHLVLKHVGFVPEMYDVQMADVKTHREGYPLRPELIESLVFSYRATGDKSLLAVGEDLLRAIQHSARTECGYATVKDSRDHRLEDRMESFFLAETSKYLYLLFDVDNFIHAGSGKVHRVASRTCVLDSGAYVFNTEAHPLDAGALDCCYGPTDDDIWRDAWFPDRSAAAAAAAAVDPTSILSYTDCRAPSWKSVFSVRRKAPSCPARRTTSGSKIKSKQEACYSSLTCEAAKFMERLCVDGEVCQVRSRV